MMRLTSVRPVSSTSPADSRTPSRVPCACSAPPASSSSKAPLHLPRRALLAGLCLTPSGRALALGPWDFGQLTYNDAAATEATAAEAETPTVVATEGSALAAVAALLEGLDALRAVQRINGSVGGARARSRNLLPRYSAAVAEMTARLPTAVALMGEGVDKEDATKILAGDVLVGASTVAAMARFAAKGEFDSYADTDIPFGDVDKAVEAASRILAELPFQQVEAAQRERCRRKLNAAEDYQAMQDVASSPICDVAYQRPRA